MMMRLLGSVVSLGLVGAIVTEGDMLGGSGGGSTLSSSGAKRITISQDNASFRPSGGHRFVSARTNPEETRLVTPQTTTGTGGGTVSGFSGTHLPDTVQAQVSQIKSSGSGAKMGGHALGGSVAGFVALVNTEMDALLSKIDPSDGKASALACLLPGREAFCPSEE